MRLAAHPELPEVVREVDDGLGGDSEALFLLERVCDGQPTVSRGRCLDASIAGRRVWAHENLTQVPARLPVRHGVDLLTRDVLNQVLRKGKGLIKGHAWKDAASPLRAHCIQG